MGLVSAAAGLLTMFIVPATHPSLSQLELAIAMTVMAAAGAQWPLLVTPKVKVNTSSAVYFAAALTLDPGCALAVAGLSQLAGGLILTQRRNPLTGRPRRRLIDTLFNTSQWMLATSAAGLTFHQLAGSDAGETSYTWFAGLLTAALIMYLTNTGLVAMAAAIQTRLSVRSIWLAGRRVDAITEAGLYVIGAVASVAAPAHPWVLVGLVIPTLLLHNSLHRTLQLQRQTVAAVEQMADLVDLRDGYTGQHSERVADYAERTARRLRLSSAQVATIRLAARVHDIGKIAIPDRILHKPGRLDADEWGLMKSHVDAGCQVLERFDDYALGLELVRCHHERIDGSGYPRGLGAERIPLGAQVIGIADAIDAMTSDRPYRRALPVTAAAEELVRAAGTRFSPEVVEAALDALGFVRDAAPGYASAANCSRLTGGRVTGGLRAVAEEPREGAGSVSGVTGGHRTRSFYRRLLIQRPPSGRLRPRADAARMTSRGRRTGKWWRRRVGRGSSPIDGLVGAYPDGTRST